MGFFSKSFRDKDFDVEANAPLPPAVEPPLVHATPIDYAAVSLPTPAEAVSNNAIHQQHVASHEIHLQQTQRQKLQQPSQGEQLPPPLGRFPTNVPVCHHCGATNVATRTSTYLTIETWLMTLGLLLVFWPICWFPLVVDSTKTTDHVCTHCQNVVGTVKPLSDCCVRDRG